MKPIRIQEYYNTLLFSVWERSRKKRSGGSGVEAKIEKKTRSRFCFDLQRLTNVAVKRKRNKTIDDFQFFFQPFFPLFFVLSTFLKSNSNNVTYISIETRKKLTLLTH